MDANEAKALLHRYLEGNASPDEILLVEQWYQHLADAGEWNWDEGEKEKDEGEKQKLEDAIEGRLLHQIRSAETPVRKINAVKWVAAAVFVLLAGTASWLLFFNTKKESAAISQRFGNDVAPGRNAAILTLAGGKQLILDSGATGTISQQGNATVFNRNGRLTYTASQEKPKESFYNTLTTPKGNQYQLVLPDGSKVWLNAASSITYPTAFTGDQRKVTISGEAYFEVAANTRQPFVVQEGNMTIQVLGTHFNINGYNDEAAVKTTLLEGAVRIVIGSNNNLLKPGQQAILTRNDDRITVVNDADIEEVIAWKNGEFHFTDTSIESIMRQISRWYDVDVVYDAPVSGHFVADIPRNVPLSQLLHLLEVTGQVHFRIEGKKITVIR